MYVNFELTMLGMMVYILLCALFSFSQVSFKFKALLCGQVFDFLLQKHAQHLLSKCLEVPTTSCEYFFQFCRVKKVLVQSVSGPNSSLDSLSICASSWLPVDIYNG